MSPRRTPASRLPATHARRPIVPDGDFELGLAAHLRGTMSAKSIVELWGRFVDGTSDFDAILMRRAILRALAVRVGNGLRIDPASGSSTRRRSTSATASSSERRRISRAAGGGTCRLGNRVWIGPQAYLDARDLVIEDDVGIGPGVRILGSAHTGLPHRGAGDPDRSRDQPVRIERGADVGVNAVVLPGVTIGRGSDRRRGRGRDARRPPLAIVCRRAPRAASCARGSAAPAAAGAWRHERTTRPRHRRRRLHRRGARRPARRRRLARHVLDDLCDRRPREPRRAFRPNAVALVVGDVRNARRWRRSSTAPRRSSTSRVSGCGIRSRPRARTPTSTRTVTLALLEAARAARRPARRPRVELRGLRTARREPMDEDHPTQPTTVYGAAKLAGEAYARAFHRSFGLPVVIVRPFNAYGPRGHHEGDERRADPALPAARARRPAAADLRRR